MGNSPITSSSISKATRPLVVFADDWGRHPSSCQHLIGHLFEYFDITWVNTIGTRRPSVNLATALRAVEKIRHWGKQNKAEDSQAKAPRVLNPLMYPSFGSRYSRALNRCLIFNNLRRNVNCIDTSTVITTIPVVADLVSAIPTARWIYYCVDDFSEWPGLDGQPLRDMETKLIHEVHAVVAAGDNLAQRIVQLGREPIVINHGVDLDHWEVRKNADLPPCLHGLEPPFAVFWGLIDRRLDVQMLRSLGIAMERGSIVLVGPQQNPNPALRDVPRLHLVGEVPYSDLPQIAAVADTLIMPYADLPVTRAMQPLKLKEYLSTGRPVVARDLPATAEWRDAMFIANTAREFADHVLHCFAQGLSRAQAEARTRLREESWRAKAQMLKNVLIPECRAKSCCE